MTGSGAARLAILASGLLTAALASATDVDTGRQMYRKGVLSSGEPLTAIVAGDVEILGTQFSCQSCHGRSGMGASEGAYIVPPIAGQFLFVESPQPPRPAYTTASLARLLREGVTPGGRYVGELMPRYRMSDSDIESLTAYLRTLSSGNSPGVDDETIRFATVVTDSVDPAERAAVLSTVRRFAEDINRQTRNESARWDRGYTPESKLQTVFREWVVDEWLLTGPESGWSEQLDAYYAAVPVFALVSGRSNSGWGPVGRFCERHEVACLLPSVALPDRQDGDFYTLHFSAGLELEARLIAADVRQAGVGRVVQAYCETEASRAAAALHVALTATEVSVEDVPFDCRSGLPRDTLQAGGANAATAVILWMEKATLAALDAPVPGERVYVSSTLLDGDVPAVLVASGGPVYLAHPYVLPGKVDPAFRRFAIWAKTRDIQVEYPRLQSEAFFASLVLNDAVKHLGRFFVRDYALDMLDHAPGLMAYLPYYPRPTVGPGQRFLSKGGYIVPVIDGSPDSARAVWITP
jgi:cytochrome c553